MTSQACTETLWRFVRGDLPPADFEQWICTTPAMEPDLGPDLYLRTVSADFKDAYDVDAVRAAIESFLRNSRPAPCACLEMRDLQVVPMGHDERRLASIAEVKRRGDPFWWLWIGRCWACRQWWLVAAEERQNDNYCLRRMSDVEAATATAGGAWPADFDHYEALIRLGIEAGEVFRFVNPMDQKHTLADLARERPGIRVSELARLLALDVAVAAALAKHVVATDGVDVTFDAPTVEPHGNDGRGSRTKWWRPWDKG